MNEENPWFPCGQNKLKEWTPEKADILFLGGMDWMSIPESQRQHFPVPIMNLIQNVRHANPDMPLYSFLSHRAVRICVSQEVQHAIEETGKVNGPIFTINNGLDIDEINLLCPMHVPRKYKVCIAGLKNPSIALQLLEMFQNHGIQTICLTQYLPRKQFLEVLGQSDIAVVLPIQQEGYFLPYWEAVAAGCLPICPKHEGATSQFVDGVNGFFPFYTAEHVFQSVQACMRLSTEEGNQIKSRALELCKNRTLLREREHFLEIVRQVHVLY